MNVIAIIAAAAINMIIGAFWYSPSGFCKKWMEATGKTMENCDNSRMPQMFGFATLCSLVTALILSYFIGLTGAVTFGAGATVGLLAWVGFVATSALSATGVLWEGRPEILYGLFASYTFISFVLMGALLALWR